MKKYYTITIIATCIIVALTLLFVRNSIYKTVREEVTAEVTAEMKADPIKAQAIDIVKESVEPISPEDETVGFDPYTTPSEEYCGLSLSEIELIATCTMGEAEGEPELGQRLVIDTILNRVDDFRFPNTAREVIWQSNQFSCMWSSRIESCYAKEDIVELVLDECKHRTNSEVLFFMAGDYIGFGTPLFQVGGHCFSTL